MTIGIGVCLPEEVLLVADGRRVSLYKEGEPVETDTCKKIIRLSTSNETGVALISFGVSAVTGLAIKILEGILPHTNNHLGATPEDICKVVDAAIAGAWTAITPCFASNIDLTRDDHIAAFVVGGRVKNVPFIGVTARSAVKQLNFECSTAPTASVVLSSAGDIARNIFLTKVAGDLDIQGQGKNDSLKIREAYLSQAKDTVREVEKLENSIGGVITYSVVSAKGEDNIDEICVE